VELHALGHKYLFVDLTRLPAKHFLRSPNIALPLGYMPMTSIWTNNFDAIVYTDVMFPNTKAAKLPDGVRTSRQSR
jgi:hypothetical protein